MEIRWTTAFLDRPAATSDAATAFWLAATGTTLSARRGDGGRFATLVPPAGDAHLRTQRVDDGGAGTHLDLHVVDPDAAAAEAVELGASVVARPGGHVVLRSPGGLAFCTVVHRGEAVRAPAVPSPTPDARAVVDQVCVDVPPGWYAAEVAFWSALLGTDAHGSTLRPEFTVVDRPTGLPLRLLVQRLDEAPAGQPTGAHLDLACEDRDATVAHHLAVGATLVERFEHWTVLADPSGAAYCCTDRHPDTGVIATG